MKKVAKKHIEYKTIGGGVKAISKLVKMSFGKYF
jgi:hypothetical protein